MWELRIGVTIRVAGFKGTSFDAMVCVIWAKETCMVCF